MSNCDFTAFRRPFLHALRELTGSRPDWMPCPFQVAECEPYLHQIADRFQVKPVLVFQVLFDFALECSAAGNSELVTVYASILQASRRVHHA